MRDIRSSSTRVSLAVAAAGIAAFALLYAPQPVLPQLAERFQLDPGSASLAISVATGALAVAVVPVATLAEIVGRRPVILVSVTVSVLLGLALPLAPSYALFLGLRALQGAAIAGFAGVAAAYLAEQLGRAGVAAAVGAMIAGNTIGGMSGRLASGLSAEWIGWRGALTVVAVLAAVCSSATIALLARAPGVPRSSAVVDNSGMAVAVRGVGTALRQRVLLGQYAVALLAMGAFVAMYNVVGFRLTAPPLHLSPTLASLVFCIYAVGTVSSATAGRLVARCGRRRILMAALACTALGIAATLPDSLPTVIMGFVIFTGGFFASHAVANGWVAAAAPSTARGQATGLYTLAYYLGSSLGGTTGSVVFTHGGWPWLVAVTVGWLAVAAAAVFAASANVSGPTHSSSAEASSHSAGSTGEDGTTRPSPTSL